MTWVTLTAQTTGMGIIVFGVLTALLTRYRQWRTPAPAGPDDTMAVADAVREPPQRVRVIWHYLPCGCWCGSDGQTLVCPACALKVPEVRDVLAWERERHQQ